MRFFSGLISQPGLTNLKAITGCVKAVVDTSTHPFKESWAGQVRVSRGKVAAGAVFFDASWSIFL